MARAEARRRFGWPGATVINLSNTPDKQFDGPPTSTAPMPFEPISLHLQPQLPKPYRITEVHLELRTPFHGTGLLYYEIGGRMHPSPLLASRGRYFAIVQPLPPLKRVRFYFELRAINGELLRAPAAGMYEMRVGVPCVRVRTKVGLASSPR